MSREEGQKEGQRDKKTEVRGADCIGIWNLLSMTGLFGNTLELKKRWSRTKSY